ncbi:hypothetical protein CDL15_Pgr020864 [Punica granatum]|uniref:Uncharacterized protein n=1 Tax=Punica granatum TaxID=22663 RepID=A0A218XVP5_PUNGR|nr:hypothetical protein CDL15_Pgr020864 [Punica granatum]
MFLRASHSTKKLLIAPLFDMFRTFTATIFWSSPTPPLHDLRQWPPPASTTSACRRITSPPQATPVASSAAGEGHQPPDPDPEPSGGDFEFCLEDPVAMLPADELFSNGKFVPLQMSLLKPSVRVVTSMKNSTSSSSSNPKSFKNFLNRGSNASSSSDSSLNMPLLKDLDSDFVMIYPHLSLSSSPFGSQEHEEVF